MLTTVYPQHIMQSLSCSAASFVPGWLGSKHQLTNELVRPPQSGAVNVEAETPCWEPRAVEGSLCHAQSTQNMALHASHLPDILFSTPTPTPSMFIQTQFPNSSLYVLWPVARLVNQIFTRDMISVICSDMTSEVVLDSNIKNQSIFSPLDMDKKPKLSWKRLKHQQGPRTQVALQRGWNGVLTLYQDCQAGHHISLTKTVMRLMSAPY